MVGWIDFDGLGFTPTSSTFGGDVVINQAVIGGTTTFNFDVPPGSFSATGDATFYARFRLFPQAEITALGGLAVPFQFDGRNGFNQLTPSQVLVQSKGGEVEDYRWLFSGGALAVTLADLRAEAQSDHVLVSWETVSELNNQGFNLYRGTSPDAPGQQINPALIPAQAPGSAQGARYTWQDADVTPGATYFYWLEDVDFSGATTLHGPVSVDYQAPTAVTLGGLTAGAAHSPAPLGMPMAAWPAAAGAAAAALVMLRRRQQR